VPGLGAVTAKGGDNGARATLTAAQTLALLAVVKDGQRLDLKAHGKLVAEISLSGSSAILRWVDAYQGRAGGVTALVATGPAPASAVPLQAAPPHVTSARPVDQTGLPTQAPRSLLAGDSDCDLDTSDPSIQPDDTVARLAPAVVLWGPECAMGAYNEVTQLFIGDEHAGHAQKLKLPEPAGMMPTPEADGLLINAEFDTGTQTLSSFDKGRGIGDCGSTTQWIWDGKAFELAGQTMMPACRGIVGDDWPATYIAIAPAQ
jgi:hypothetical protein